MWPPFIPPGPSSFAPGLQRWLPASFMKSMYWRPSGVVTSSSGAGSVSPGLPDLLQVASISITSGDPSDALPDIDLTCAQCPGQAGSQRVVSPVGSDSNTVIEQPDSASSNSVDASKRSVFIVMPPAGPVLRRLPRNRRPAPAP